MKRIVLIILLFCNHAEAQHLTADDFIRQCECRNFDCFNDFITNRGFSFDHVENEEKQKSYMFFSDEFIEGSNVRTKDVVLFTIADGIFISAGIRTADKRFYQRLINEFKKMGFVVTMTNDTTNRVNISYRSAQFKNIIVNLTIDKAVKNDLSWTSYYIAVFRFGK